MLPRLPKGGARLPMNGFPGVRTQNVTGAVPAEYGDKTSLVINAITRSGIGSRKPTGSFLAQYGTFGNTDLNGDLAISQMKGLAVHPTDPGIVWAAGQDNGTEKFTGRRVFGEISAEDERIDEISDERFELGPAPRRDGGTDENPRLSRVPVQ